MDRLYLHILIIISLYLYPSLGCKLNEGKTISILFLSQYPQHLAQCLHPCGYSLKLFEKKNNEQHFICIIYL